MSAKKQKIIEEIMALCSAKLAENIHLLDVKKKSSVTDYMIIATCKNERQQKSILNEVLKHLSSEYKLKPFHREITKDSGWSILDYGFVMLHLFSADQRERYQLDELWAGKP